MFLEGSSNDSDSLTCRGVSSGSGVVVYSVSMDSDSFTYSLSNFTSLMVSNLV